MKKLIGILYTLLVTSCTNHLYQGITEYEIAGNQICEAKVYSHDTTWFLSKEGKPSIITIEQGGTNEKHQFDYSDTGSYVLVKPTGFYEAVYNVDSAYMSDTELKCGTFSGFDAYVRGESSETSFQMNCNKLGMLGPDMKSMNAKESPYIFKMDAPVSEFSWFGEQLGRDAERPKCRPKEN